MFGDKNKETHSNLMFGWFVNVALELHCFLLVTVKDLSSMVTRENYLNFDPLLNDKVNTWVGLQRN